jgi:fatty-acyl-CoA synthase
MPVHPVLDWLAKRAELTPGATALVDAATGREYTYEEFDGRAGRLAGFMLEGWGLSPGDRVAALAHNSTEYFEALFAAAKAGVVLVPLNWRLALPELQGIVADARPAAIIHDGSFADVAEALLGGIEGRRRMAFGSETPGGGVALESAIDGARRAVMEGRLLGDLWYLLYTAGTTGRPKGVLQTFEMALFNYLNIGIPIGLTASDTTLNVLPTFHTGGINLYAVPTLLVGGTAIIQKTFEPGETLQLLSERTTAFFGVPAVYLFLSQHPAFDETDLSGVRSWACGGAPMPVPLLERYAERGIVIRQGFCMTETGPTVFLVDEARAVSKAGSVGMPQMFVEVRIADREGRDVPAGAHGELLIRGPAVTPGYWNLPDVTAEALEDGWLHSGDVARRDADGYFYIVDRWKDMYISGGQNVYPAEVENALYGHPAVAEAAVIGVPDERWGEVGRAVVVLAAGADASAEELVGFCRERLAGFKVPRSVVFVDSLPRNAAGKVLKQDLRAAHGAP